MKTYITAGAALLMTTGIATAGGLDRSGQGIGAIFEDGDYAELSFGSISPSITGTGLNATFSARGTNTGNIAPAYTQLGMAYKTQFSDELSFALIYDQPFGASVDYATAGYAISSAAAEVESDGVTGLIRYAINPAFSVHAGLRYVQVNGTYNRAPLPDLDGPGPLDVVTAYNSTYSAGDGVGYVLGGAYERPDIALRVAVTYNGEIDLDLPGSAGSLSTTLPESVNLDFQTGIAADTLLFGSVRYVAWDGFSLIDSDVGSILDYDDDVYTYNVGIGRRVTDALAVSFAIGYEASTGDQTGQLGPTDGFISYQIGVAYELENGVELSGGIRYVDLGDATTKGITAEFNDNSVTALGLKVAYSF